MLINFYFPALGGFHNLGEDFGQPARSQIPEIESPIKRHKPDRKTSPIKSKGSAKVNLMDFFVSNAYTNINVCKRNSAEYFVIILLRKLDCEICVSKTVMFEMFNSNFGGWSQIRLHTISTFRIFFTVKLNIS